jgi:hypothetical protein
MGVHVDPIFLQKPKKIEVCSIIMYTTLIIGPDQIQIEIAWVWELGFAQQERKRRGGKRKGGKRRGGRTSRRR